MIGKQIKWIFNEKKQSFIDIIIIIFFFTLYLSFALHLPINMGPDELMRYDIPEWIFNHGRLPIGNEKELINSIWGISYGFTPYLPSIVAVGFMKIFAIIFSGKNTLIFAARLTSVFAGTVTIWLTLLIGDEVYGKRYSKYLFAVLIGSLPQFVYLCAYFNNDIFSIMSCTMILYAWIIGVKNNWNIKSCIILGVGIGLCALTYYNAYGYILCSLAICILMFWKYRDNKFERNIFIKKTVLVLVLVLLIAGWYFVRNYIIYNGDILGINSSRTCGEMYALDQYKPSLHMTYKKMGKTIIDLICDNTWIKYTLKSYIACFGYMTIWTKPYVYKIYYFIILVGVISFIFSLRKNLRARKHFLLYIMLLTIVIPIILSLYNSYATDYQPQGRYIMSGLPALMLFVTGGYDYIDKKQTKENLIPIIILLIWILLFIFVFSKAIYVFCWEDRIF